MGTHIKYRAIDENSQFFKMCKEYTKIAKVLRDLWGGDVAEWMKTDSMYLKAHRACKLMYMETPSLRDVGVYFSNKAWGALLYLLSDKRRYMADGDENDLVERGIVGGDLLTEPDIIRPVRYITAEEVKQFSVFLAQIDYVTLFEHYDDERMEQMEVYRVRSYENQKDWIIDLFSPLRDFYLKTSFHSFAITTWFVH